MRFFRQKFFFDSSVPEEPVVPRFLNAILVLAFGPPPSATALPDERQARGEEDEDEAEFL